MKKIIVILLLILVIITPCYAVNIVDTMLCKKVLLRANRRFLRANHTRQVLVSRVTGEVKYILQDNKQWVPLAGTLKQQCQKIYNAQTGK